MRNQDNLVQSFRDSTYMLFGFALASFLTPFSVYSFVSGRILMGVLTAFIIASALASSFAILRRGRRAFSYWIVYLPILAAFGWGILKVTPMVAFWCYPVAVVTLFVSSRARGRIMALVGLLVILPCAYLAMDTRSFVRFAPTYVMTCYFVDLVVGLIDRLQGRLTDLAITDSLTGAFNRRHFDLVLPDAVQQHRRGHVNVSLLSLDIDHFKEINDRFGHAAGDEVLRGLVREVLKRIRSTDTLCRIGGEEFAVIARGVKEKDAIELGETLRKHISAAELLAGMPVTISVGVAQCQGDESPEELLHRSDQRLYEAKRLGRNQVWPRGVSDKASIESLPDSTQSVSA